MSFWQERLGVVAPPAAPTPAPATSSNRPWWLPGLAPQSATVPVQQPAPYQYQPGLTQQQQASVTPDGQQHFGDLLRQDGYTTEKAQSARDTELCPECSSPNYIAPKGMPNAMKQCFNCGYNPRFAHSTAGASGIGQQNVSAPQAARVQINTPPAGFPAFGSRVGTVTL